MFPHAHTLTQSVNLSLSSTLELTGTFRTPKYYSPVIHFYSVKEILPLIALLFTGRCDRPVVSHRVGRWNRQADAPTSGGHEGSSCSIMRGQGGYLFTAFNSYAGVGLVGMEMAI